MKIKICGITRVDDARLAAEAGADTVGLNFYPASPRWVDPATAAAIVTALPAATEAIGVFVNSPVAQVRATVETLGLRGVQLHGDEPPEALAGAWSVRLIRAFRIRNVCSLGEIRRFLDRCQALGRRPDAVLADAYVAGRFGGSGQTFAWELLRDRDPDIPLILAGGLTPDNVAEAIRAVRPWAVDVASGVEAAPGRKDPHRLRAFIDRARRGFAEIAPSP